MRIFSNLREAHGEIQRDLFEVGEWVQGATYQDKNVEGNPDFDFMELRPYVYSLTGADDLEQFIEEQGLNREWITIEFQERLTGGINPGAAWKLRSDVWREFLERPTIQSLSTDGVFSYTYSERLMPSLRVAQIAEVTLELYRHPASRQCVMTIFDVHKDHQNLGGQRRIPCSMFYQTMIRNGMVDLHYVMRSCDFFTHFPYDQILALKLQRHIATCLNRPVGIFHHIITSLHAFRKDFSEGVF